MARPSWGIALTLAGTMGWGSLGLPAATAQQEPRNKAADHATSEGDRSRAALTAPADKGRVTWPGMTREGTVLLPNGWSLKPAGRQAKLGDLPVQIEPHPSRPILAILHAGYGEHEVVTVDGTAGREGGRVIGRAAVPGTFAGLAWSADGRHLYVGGGFDDLVYRFDHADGLLSNKTAFEYPDRKEFLAEARQRGEDRILSHQRTPAGLAIARDGKTLYVSAAFGHSLGRFDAQTGEFQGEVSLGPASYPFSVALDESRGRLYVSLWSKAAVAVVEHHVVPRRRELADAGAPQRDPAGARREAPVRGQRQPQHGHGDRRRRGQGRRDDRHGDPPQRPLGEHAEFPGPLARRVDVVRRQCQHE